MKLSIIIPVYNTASTLDRCVRSVAEQADVSAEIIIIDDGSQDSSPTLCDLWAERDERITVVHKENGGLSDARNRGIEIATGDYLMFIDSDDYLAQQTIQSIAEIIQKHPKYDIIEFPVLRFCGSPRESFLSFDDREYTDIRDYWLSCRAYEHSYAWNKAYRRRIFDTVRFPARKVFEDIHTLPLLLERANIVATTSRGQYVYCYNPQGITATADAQAYHDLLEAHIRLLPHFDFRTPQEQDYYMHILNIQITENQLSDFPPQLPTARINPSWVDSRFRLKALLLRFLGVKGLCRLNRLMKTCKRKHQ